LAFDVNPIVALSVVIAVVFLFSRIVASRRREAAEDDPEQPYSVFTHEFDVVCTGRELGPLLANEGIDEQISRKAEITDLQQRRQIAEHAYQSARERFAAVRLGPEQPPGESAVAFLVDQSGSMANRMPVLAGQLKAAAEQLESLGIAAAIFGFTTVGWRGGKAREAWQQQGRPQRPGRLCALLHVIYKTFDAPMADEDWSGLLQVEVLRENVDGEALHWAVGLLKKLKAGRRILIVLSDGAPVDDSTLMENGAGFLWRHFEQVVAEVAGEDSISLAAIGVEHSIDEVYPTAASVKDVDDVPDALRSVLSRLLV
jgi:cobaltochelatase CobT